MKILMWIKSLSWVAIAGAAASAVYLVFNAVRASQLEDRAEIAEKEATDLMQIQTAKNINAANKLQQNVAKDKKSAAKRRVQAEIQLEKISEDRTMADIANNFNSRQLRDRTG